MAHYAHADDSEDCEYVFTALGQSKSMDFVQVHQLESAIFFRSSYCFKNDVEDAWIMDTGATQHMTHRKDFFWSYEYCHLNSIFLADDSINFP